MRRVYQVAALAFFAVAVFVMLEARNLVYYTRVGPGAGFFPFWLGLLLAVLAIVWFAQVSFQPAADPEEGFIPDRAGALRIVSILVAVLVVGLLMGIVGFQLIMFVFLLFLLVALGRQHPAVTLVISVAGSFGLYYIFKGWLDVQLPASSIEFLRNLGL